MTYTNDAADTFEAPDKLLRLREVMDLTALSRATIYREIEHGGFPKPIKFGAAARWSTTEIMGHIDGRKSQR